MEFNTYTELINQYYADEKRAVLEYDTYRRRHVTINHLVNTKDSIFHLMII